VRSRLLVFVVVYVYDFPVSFFECVTLVGNKVSARRVTRRLSTGLSRGTGTIPDISGPITTESRVKDGDVVHKVLVRVAASSWPVGNWGTPRVGLWCFVRNVTRNFCSFKPEDGDSGIVPFERVNTTSVLVERSSVVVLGPVIHLTTSSVVGFRTSTVDSTNKRRRSAKVFWDSAAGAGVDRRLVDIIVMNTFNDIDFSFVGPIGTVGPKCGPGAATGRHVH